MSTNLALKMKTLDDNHISKIDPKEISSIFNILNAKPDSIIKTFPRGVKISIDDIFNLKLMIDNKLEQYTLTGNVEFVSVRFANNSFKDFKDWVQFREEVKIDSNYIENINIVWDFMLSINNYGIPQRHTIVVRLSSFMSKSQMIQMMLSGNIEDMDEIDKKVVPVMCKVDCVNSSIGEEIVQIVGNWNEGLEKYFDKSDKFEKLRKHRVLVAHSIKYSFTFSSIFITSTVAIKYFQMLSIDKVSDLALSNINLIIMAIPFVYMFIELAKRLGFYLGDKTLECLYNYGDYHPFSISKGDKNKQISIKESNTKNKNIAIKITLSILLNTIISVVATIIANNITS